MKTNKTKIITGQMVLAFVPIVTSILASQQWMLEMFRRKGYMTVSLVDIRRCMIILTFTVILWSFFNLLKDMKKLTQIYVVTIITSSISILFIILTLHKIGW